VDARKAVYAASLDPITNGHLDIIKRMAPLFEELIVLVAVDARKKYHFSQDERLDMAGAAVAYSGLKNVSVQACVGEYVVSKAKKLGASVVIRGIRNNGDLEAESALATENWYITPQIETLWVPCRPEFAHVSSSLVRSHIGVDPDWETQVARLVPKGVVRRLKNRYALDRAKLHWEKLAKDLAVRDGMPEVLAKILERYNESHRYYHNLEHIVLMLDELDLSGGYTPELALAIWLHDVIYDPKGSGNEMASALYANDLLKDKVERPVIERVSALIMVTEHNPKMIPVTPEAQLIADLDLAILGKKPSEFFDYEKKIRNEYHHVSDYAFKEGRSKILLSFLARHTIYSTSQFRDKYELQARENIERSLDQLRLETH
jgi:pantetheine-phosphate adenylyltransferase